MRGLSNLVVSMVMLSIMIPVGGIIIDRVSAVGDFLDSRSSSMELSYPKVSVYSFRNQTSTVVLIYNYGSKSFSIDMLVSISGFVEDISITIDPGEIVLVSTDLDPPIGVVVNDMVIWGYGD